MYAVLDIETTGGLYNEEGITEIAIYRYDGHKVTDQFISLINPEKEIQPFVVNLTGINNAMLRSAPKFYEVAKRIIEITDGCIIVAHNALFDYRVLQTEFRRLGFDFQRKSICTVELAKKLIPEQPSYSLGKLVRSLGIAVSDRHRATGDAQATLKLFKLLLAKDTGKIIVQETLKSETTGTLPPKLLDIVEKLPTSVGVFYIHGDDGKILYIGRGKNIKKKVNQHFTGVNQKSKRIQKEVKVVTYEETGSELVALLKENEEIKLNQPIYNQTSKQKPYNFALYQEEDENGYLRLFVGKADSRKNMLTTFSNVHEGKNTLFKLTEEFVLCTKINGISEAKKNCYNFSISKCHGACIEKEEPLIYNQRVVEAIKKYSYPYNNMVIVDKGREIDERSAIVIEAGQFVGLGFYNLNYQINNTSVLSSVITKMNNKADANHIIQSYLRKHSTLKIIKISETVSND